MNFIIIIDKRQHVREIIKEYFPQNYEERNSVFAVGIFEEVLRLRLNDTESVDMAHVYVGEIRNICDHEKLNEYFDTLSEVL